MVKADHKIIVRTELLDRPQFRPDDTDTSAAETYSAKLTYLAGLITGTGADIVALQAVGAGASSSRRNPANHAAHRAWLALGVVNARGGCHRAASAGYP
ncbi:hypothetical protein [Micromonospora sp. NPDC047740]|uniref:hypothetical protein n=1 Tax=Micromonospora sp. NPDC047740 TaxID=3364254 RepID=UPI00371D6BFB